MVFLDYSPASVLSFMWEKKADETVSYLQKLVELEPERPPVLWGALAVCLLGQLNFSINSFHMGHELTTVRIFLLATY